MNIRPCGALLPNRFSRRHLTAWRLGFRDGWQQPYDLGVSTNVDHLADDNDSDPIYESLDRGINAGQWLRSPLRHQVGA